MFIGTLAAAVLYGCGGSTATSPATPTAATAFATWGVAAKLADAGPALQPAFGGPIPPLVRFESLSDGTAFALWERMDPETVAAARFFAGAWEAPVQGSGQGRLDSWLAASINGSATITWGERVPELGMGDFTRRTWARRYLPGSGWTAPERLQSVPGQFNVPRTIGANIGQPPLHTGVVMSDSGGVHAFWNRGYLAEGAIFSPTDVYSSRVAQPSSWSPEEPAALAQQISFLRVSRSRTLAFWLDGLSPERRERIQVFDASRGWQPPWAEGFRPFGLITGAREGFAITQFSNEGRIVRGLGLNGDLGPPELLVSNLDLASGGPGSSDLCGNEFGALAFVRSVSDQFSVKYRGASDAQPGFTATTLIAPGRLASDPVVCHVDSLGRMTVVWLASQATYADHYLPGKGFEGTSSIGPPFATVPAVASDAQGNVLVTWAVLTADKKVEIWWNRLRVP